MKNFAQITVFVVLSFFCFSIIKAENIDDIINNHIEAHGGAEKWNEIKSMKITGKYTSFSIPKGFTTYKLRPNKFYSHYHLGKHQVTEAYNGETGWTIDPWQDIDFPRRINKAETNRLLQKAVFCTPLFNYKKEGYKAEFVGKENLEGVDVYHIKLTKPDNSEETWYLDASTYLAYKSLSSWTDFAYPTRQYVYYDDFREVHGVKIPFYVERTFGTRYRVTEIENIELNPEIEPSIFEMPIKEETQKIAFLKGEYNVTVDAMTRRGNWRTVDSTTSVIEFTGKNILTENISYERFFPVAKTTNWTFHNSNSKYRMVVYSDFHSDQNFYEGEFTDTLIAFDNTNISFGDSTYQAESHTKYEIKDITGDGFTIMTYMSRNKGKSWHPRERLVYRRKE